MLLPNWRSVLLHAWSIKLMLLAGLLSGVEVVVPLAKGFGWIEWMPAGAFAALSGLVVAAAFIARLVAQREMSA